VLDACSSSPRVEWLRADVIDEGWRRSSEFYQNTGYIFAQIEREIVEREGDNWSPTW
jgi:outer membrane protein assembly factor BamA